LVRTAVFDRVASQAGSALCFSPSPRLHAPPDGLAAVLASTLRTLQLIRRSERSDDIFTRRDDFLRVLKIPEKALSQPSLSA